jgi:hypothetical protein
MPRSIDRIVAAAVYHHARRAYRRFRHAAANATGVQQRVLLRRLALNADSDFARDHHFDRIRNYRDFVANVPVLDYEYYKPYIEQTKQGRTHALLGSRQRLLMFALTSGTTDQPKFIPVTKAFLRDYRSGWTVFGVKMFMDHRDAVLRPILQVTSPMDEFTTDAGTPCGAITGLMAATQKRLVRRYYASPLEAAHVADATAKYYTIMRLAIPRDVAFIITANPATQLRLASVADEYRDLLIRDIHDGSLTQRLPIDPHIRNRLEPYLQPAPKLARRLQRLVAEHNALLPRHYWRLSFLANWIGGTLSLYLRQLPRYFGNLPVRDIGLLASEGRMSVPLTDGTPAGVLDFQHNFFEFIPADQIDSSKPDVLRSGELQIDQEYFVLLTTASGLYRYDIRDRVRVVDYLSQAPVIEFLHKGAHVSSMTGEKLTERQVVHAVQRLSQQLGLTIESFVLAPRWDDPPFYRLHVETAHLPPNVSGDHLCRQLDDALGQANIEYRSKRHTARLGPVQLNLLPDGCLAQLDRQTSQRRGRAEQFKHQFLYTTPDADDHFPLAQDP